MGTWIPRHIFGSTAAGTGSLIVREHVSHFYSYIPRHATHLTLLCFLFRNSVLTIDITCRVLLPYSRCRYYCWVSNYSSMRRLKHRIRDDWRGARRSNFHNALNGTLRGYCVNTRTKLHLFVAVFIAFCTNGLAQFHSADSADIIKQWRDRDSN